MRIEIRQLGKRFGSIVALRDVNLEVMSKTRVALIGPNGSGKSTLTRVLMGLLSYTGEIGLDGLSPARDRVELARRMAYVPQVAPQMKVPVGDLLRTVIDVRNLDRKVIRQVAEELGLDLDAIRRRLFRDLSGGMKQKLLIAMALSTGASLLIMDEPTDSLDVAARDRFFSLFERFAGEATLVLCSHRLEEIRHLVTHVVALEEGRVAYDGSAAEYLAQSALSVVEVLVENGEYSTWLADRGFHPRPGGWWAGRVSHAEKMSLLSALSETLSDSVTNLLVRDLETVQVSDSTEENKPLKGGDNA